MVVISILNGHDIPPKLNQTLVTLIPKRPKPNKISNFHPISLRNVIYKSITKVISNKLKPLLPSIISDTQGAFVQVRLIADNILTAFEVLHAMRVNRATKGWMAPKLDVSKAFDHVKLSFLSNIMSRMGFCRSWVDLVMKCVKLASFSFLINGFPMGHIIPSRGIRQGDPMSPYLFLLCSEGYLICWKRLLSEGLCRVITYVLKPCYFSLTLHGWHHYLLWGNPWSGSGD